MYLLPMTLAEDLILVTYPDGRQVVATVDGYALLTAEELAGTRVDPIDREALADAIRRASR